MMVSMSHQFKPICPADAKPAAPKFNPIETLIEDALAWREPDAIAPFGSFLDTLLATKPPADAWLVESLSTPSRPSPAAIATLEHLFRTGSFSKKRARSREAAPRVQRPKESAADLGLLDPLDDRCNSPLVASVDGARKNTQQRCSVCKGAGHKSRTCTFRPGPGLNSQPSPRLRLSF